MNFQESWDILKIHQAARVAQSNKEDKMNKEQWTCFEESEHATYMQKMLDGSSFPVLIRERGDRYTTLGHATCVSGAVAVYKKHIAVDERSEITASLRTEMGVELHGGPVGFLHSTKLKSGSRR